MNFIIGIRTAKHNMSGIPMMLFIIGIPVMKAGLHLVLYYYGSKIQMW
ncbi:MAG: hypothetical protein V8S95_13935 [Odoribacter sp.]